MNSEDFWNSAAGRVLATAKAVSNRPRFSMYPQKVTSPTLPPLALWSLAEGRQEQSVAFSCGPQARNCFAADPLKPLASASACNLGDVAARLSPRRIWPQFVSPGDSRFFRLSSHAVAPCKTETAWLLFHSVEAFRLSSRAVAHCLTEPA